MIGEGLRAAHPDAAQTLVALGGSGQTVGSWSNIEKSSLTKPQTLDVKRYDVQTELSLPADGIVVMLGMNDVLSPSLRDTQADIDKWAVTYETLVKTLQARTHARYVGVAQVTPCTENKLSPKNLVLAKLNAQIARIAKADGFSLLPTNDTAWSVLAEGRTWNANFHVAGDTVHPTGAGHIAIAIGMLTGFGETAGAQALRDKRLATEFANSAGTLPALTLQIESKPAVSNPNRTRDVTVRFFWHPAAGTADAPTAHLTSPDGFTPAKDVRGATGEFHVTGMCDWLTTPFSVTATAGTITKTATAVIPAAWIAGATPPNQPGWTVRNPWTFDPAAGALPFDDRIATGAAFSDSTLTVGNEPLTWTRYTPCIDYVGGADPNSVDFAAVSFFGNFSDGYAARWIYSPKERPVQLSFATSGWGGTDHLQVWVNGTSVYAGHFGRVPKAEAVAPATLKSGWNSLTFKSAHLQWLWQVSVAVNGVAGDDLADLRYATVPGK